MNALAQFLIAYPGFAIVGVLVPILALRWFTIPQGRKHTEWLLVAALLVEPLGMLCELLASCLSRLEPLKYDLYVYQIDKAMGFGNFPIGQWVSRSVALRDLVSISYGLLPAMLLLTFTVNLWDSEERGLQAAKTLALNLFGGLPIYLLFPVCGPQFAFPTFPQVPVGISAVKIAIDAAPNGVPSIHMASALLIFWFLRRSLTGKAAGLVFIALTVFATLGSGQHYVFDLLCAVPYTGLILSLAGELQSVQAEVTQEEVAA